MAQIEYHIIASGSSGNAVLINSSILIDIGVPWKEIEPYADRIRLVLTTHCHGDHFKPSTAKALHKQHPAIRWACCEWMIESLLEAGVGTRLIDLLSPFSREYSLLYEKIGVIRAEYIPHDVPNCAWHITIAKGKVPCDIFYATDTSSLDAVEAKNYDYYFVESNHSRAEIEARIAAKRIAGEYAYEEKARRNHLSEEQALDWLAANMGPHSQYIFLHQHK